MWRSGSQRAGIPILVLLWLAPVAVSPLVISAQSVDSAQAVDGQSVVAAVRVVPLGRRSSVVVVLKSDIDQLAIAESTMAGVFAVTFGPIQGRLTPLTLEAANASRLVQAVRLREQVRADGATMILVEAVSLEPIQGSVRTSGRHLYLDVAAVAR